MQYLFIILISFLFSKHNEFDGNLKSYLENNLNNYDKYEYAIISSPQELSSYKIDFSQPFRMNRNIAYVPLKTKNSSDTFVDKYLVLRLRLFKEVLVANEDVKAREPLSPDEFTKKLADVTTVIGTPLNIDYNLTTVRSKSFIRKGMVLRRENVEPLPEIFSGNYITALVVKGNVIVKVDAQSKQDGAKGDIISIVTQDRKLFKAKVLNKKEVLIVE